MHVCVCVVCVRACVRVCMYVGSWTDQSASGMGLVNINALSGTAWVETDNILSQLPNLARRVEQNGNTLSVYLDEVCDNLVTAKCYTGAYADFDFSARFYLCMLHIL